MARKKLSLGEKIALAASGNQEEDYPEDIEYETSAKVVELDEDYDSVKAVARSSLRSKNVQLLDEFDTKYSGEKVSRKKLAKDNVPSLQLSDDDGEEEDDDDDLEDDDDDMDELENGEEVLSSEEEESIGVNGRHSTSTKMDDSDMGEDEEDKESGESGEEEEDDESDMGSEEEEDSETEDTGATGMQTLSLKDKELEIEKGKATLNQIRIWDSLLEVRIRQQKMLLDCSKLPHTDMYEELISDILSSDESSTLPKIIEKSKEATKTLMHELLRLQEILTKKNSETMKALSRKSQDSNGDIDDPMNEEITSSEDDEDSKNSKVATPKGKRKNDTHANIEKAKKMKLGDFSSAAETSYKSFIPYRNQTIQKWNDKTQFAGGKFNRKTASQQISTLRQIEQILSNKERLLKRTQVKRSAYVVIGEPPVKNVESVDQEPNPEVFDDDDFYHQLLRELIERKTCNVNDPTQLSRHWLELQKLRTKLKKKVDTKASKGRKIRYDVHPKLVNFMAPQENSNMSNAAVKELFGSLFGKSKDQQE